MTEQEIREAVRSGQRGLMLAVPAGSIRAVVQWNDGRLDPVEGEGGDLVGFDSPEAVWECGDRCGIGVFGTHEGGGAIGKLLKP